MQNKTRKNYIIYVLVLLLSGGLIYVAIEEGDRFSHHAANTLNTVQDGPFAMFLQLMQDNLHHPLTTLPIQIIAVLLMVCLFSYLPSLIGQPGVIEEIVAGIVLGPSVSGLFFPETFHFLFPIHSLTNLELLNQVGLILFMLVTGMELDLSVLRSKINEALVTSHAGILVPFFLGIPSPYWIYEMYAADHTPFLSFALFIGISMSITVSPVLARIIQEQNMTKTPLGILTITSVANDDMIVWCLLVVTIAISKVGSLASALYSVGLAVACIAVMFLVVCPSLKEVGEVYVNKEAINKMFMAFILLTLIISSCLTEIIDIHALFGAFIAGAVMLSNLGSWKVMMEEIEDISLAFSLSLFFTFTGLRTEIGLINSPELWMVCLLLMTVAIVGKLGGYAIAARLVGESWKDSLIVGTLMNTRGLMELVASNIGYEMGALPSSVFVILVIMVLVITFITTPLLYLVERFSVHWEEKLSLKRKLIFCFGCPESGRSPLSIYDLLFGRQLKKEHVIVAHYAVDMDLNPLDAQHYESESFVLLNQKAVELNIQVDNHYRMTDKLVQETIHFTYEEHPDMLLLGAGSHYHPEMSGTPGVILWLTFFRDKIDGIMEQVKCPAAVFVNRNYREGAPISFVLGGMTDVSLLSYLNIMLQNGHSVRLLPFETDDGEFHQYIDDLLAHYADQIVMIWFAGVEELVAKERDGLLVMSHLSYTKLPEDELVMRELSSLPVIRRGKSKGEKSKRLGIG